MRISVSRGMNVLPGGRIIIPGTEPSTTVTSTTLEVEIRKLGIPVPAIITVKDALALIPGSRVELLENYGAPIQQLYILPEHNLDCPCEREADYYKIMRDNSRPATEDEALELMNNECSVLDGYDLLYGS